MIRNLIPGTPSENNGIPSGVLMMGRLVVGAVHPMMAMARVAVVEMETLRDRVVHGVEGLRTRLFRT